MLFILPVIYAYILLPYSNVMYGSLICLITSVINHYYKSCHNVFRIIDIITVLSIACFFTLHCILEIGIKPYANIMYILAFSALGVYVYLYDKPHLYCSHHCIIHILAITGIMFYIKARHTYIK